VGLSDWAPLVGALLALTGVVYASRKTGENMITAEDRRAAAAIVAEQERARLTEIAEDKRVRASIEADDRRAKAMIDAENLRHENDLRRATREHLLDAVRDTYIALEASRSELSIAALMLATDKHSDVESWRVSTAYQRQNFSEARTAFADSLGGITLLGSDKVSDLAGQVRSASISLRITIDALTGEMPGLNRAPALDDSRKRARTLRTLCTKLLDAMRTELHLQNLRAESNSDHA
jgi:hypothetical protein